MTAHTDTGLRRTASALIVLALAATTMAITPRAASAHDSCAIARPAANGVLGTVLAFVNVFSSFLDTAEAECEDKYAGVEVKEERDWTPDPAVQQEMAAQAGEDDDDDDDEEGSAAPCVDGMAAGFFPCDGIDLMSHVPHSELGTTFLNDIWGWTDPETEREFALVGSRTGTVFVDITEATEPQVLGMMPTASTEGGSTWRDIKVYEDHAYVVSENTNHGVQVFDLTRLREWDGTYTTYEPDTRYTGHGSAHNIFINEATGYAYSVGAGPFSSKGLPNTVFVDAPSSAAGEYLASGAAFGPKLSETNPLTGPFATTTPANGCTALQGFAAGSVAIIDRGACAFSTKVENAQDAGATAVVIANNQPGIINLGGSSDKVSIPSVMVTQADGAAIKAGLPATGGLLANDPPAPCGTGLHMIDIRDPKNPIYAGCEDQTGYVHDTQCVVYSGPDREHRGKEICFNSNGLQFALNAENYVSIVDVSDKQNPVVLSRLPYAGSGYSHQGWLTEDERYFLHGDEGDESLSGVPTTTRVWDVRDLDNPFVKSVFENDTSSIDHNLYTRDGYAYASNYTSGLRVYDLEKVARRGLSEAAWFDMYPENDANTFEGGTWSNFPYYDVDSDDDDDDDDDERELVEKIAVSSIDRGLFILSPSDGDDDDDDD